MPSGYALKDESIFSALEKKDTSTMQKICVGVYCNLSFFSSPEPLEEFTFVSLGYLCQEFSPHGWKTVTSRSYRGSCQILPAPFSCFHRKGWLEETSLERESKRWIFSHLHSFNIEQIYQFFLSFTSEEYE